MQGADVLVVDDEPDIRETLRAILEGAGYRVATASNGREAIEALEHGERPKLILLDLTMPEMSGYEVLERMQGDAELAAIPVTVVSALCDHERPRAPFLRKPFELDALLETVERRVAEAA